MATPITDHRHEACTEAHASGPFAGGQLHCIECGGSMPEPCGVCGAPATTSGFVPEVEPVSMADLDAPSGSEARQRAEAHALRLCGECWFYSLEVRAAAEGERLALGALVERTGWASLQEYGIADALRACLVADRPGGRYHLDLPYARQQAALELAL
jgi:hypothetical protein